MTSFESGAPAPYWRQVQAIIQGIPEAVVRNLQARIAGRGAWDIAGDWLVIFGAIAATSWWPHPLMIVQSLAFHRQLGEAGKGACIATGYGDVLRQACLSQLKSGEQPA